MEQISVERLENRLKNYEEEEKVIKRKLLNPDVPSGKKQKLKCRLKKLEELIPQTLETLISLYSVSREK
jgi:hypothetical protein